MTFGVREATAKIYLTLSVVGIWCICLFIVINFNILTKGTNPWNKPTSRIQKNHTSPIQSHYCNQKINKNDKNGPGLLWCERRRPLDFMAEPSNSLSNFAYILFGLIMIHFGIYDQYYNTDPDKDKKSLIIQHPAFSYAFGFSNILLGICSFLFHAANMKPYGHWDVMSMYSCTLYPIWYMIFQHVHWIPKSGDVLLCIHFGILYYLFLFGLPGYSNQFVMISIVLILLVGVIATYFIKRENRVFSIWVVVAAFFSVIFGFALWNLEKVPGWCNPDAIFQFHAIWHALTGLSLGLSYWYVRIEVAKEMIEERNSFDVVIEKIEQIYDVFEEKNP
eukprot:gene8354-179_t